MKTRDDDDYDTLHLNALVVVMLALMAMIFVAAGSEVLGWLA